VCSRGRGALVWVLPPQATAGNELTTDRTLTLALSQKTPMGAAGTQHAAPKLSPLHPAPLCPTLAQISFQRREPTCSKCLRNCCPTAAGGEETTTGQAIWMPPGFS